MVVIKEKKKFLHAFYCLQHTSSCISNFFIANTDVNTRTNKSVDVHKFFEVAAIPAYRPKTFKLYRQCLKSPLTLTLQLQRLRLRWR